MQLLRIINNIHNINLNIDDNNNSTWYSMLIINQLIKYFYYNAKKYFYIMKISNIFVYILLQEQYFKYCQFVKKSFMNLN